MFEFRLGLLRRMGEAGWVCGRTLRVRATLDGTDGRGEFGHGKPIMDADETAAAGQGLPEEEAEVVAFLRKRAVPCPRCAYDLRDIPSAKCPECGEPLVLKIGSPKARFGWLVLAMAPGCFSGVAAVFVLIPIYANIVYSPQGAMGVLPLIVADVFGFFSAATVAVMYWFRHRIMSWTSRRQGVFAGTIWGVHVLAFGLLLLGLWLSR